MKMRVALALWLALSASGAALSEVEVFRSGEDGYHSYRIPALIVSKKGTLLAFCEGRRNSGGDSGDIDTLLRRSFDQGRTWQPVQKVADFGEDTVGNPTPVVERTTGAILLLLTSNPGKTSEDEIRQGSNATRNRRVWIMRSVDDGATWTAPEEITAQTKRDDWTWYATGPGNGIQLRSGRLLIPCDHNTRERDERYSHVIYSDDRGATWHIGGSAEVKTNESAVAERNDGTVLFNMRSYHGRNRRAVAFSRDGGLSWGPLTLDEALVEPVCQASLIRAGSRLLFSNPAATTRTRMTVRLSVDGGAHWRYAREIYAGPAAYSSLAMLDRGMVGLLYERGDSKPYERITLARFPLDWLKEK